MIPDSVSPVLKTRILIQLDADFPYTLDKTHFSVNATSESTEGYIRYLNVLNVDDDAKTLDCMFGGALSGVFQMNIRHRDYGLVDTTGLMLDVSSRVASFSPKVGSIYGGTLLTITGTNFGMVKTDNPVQISYNGGVGSTDCFVQTTNTNEITCRVDTAINAKNDGETGDLVVFLKTSEEASCDDVNVCNWIFTSTLPEITEMTAEYSQELGNYVVTFTGTGFEEAVKPDFQIAGVSQAYLNEDSWTTHKYTITDIADVTPSDL